MANSANLCIFEGRIVSAPQYSTIQSGTETFEKAIFRVAVDRKLSAAQRQKVKAGDKSIKTADFVSFSLIGNRVETLRNYFPVGKSIRITAHYTEYETMDSQTGTKKYGHMFEVDDIDFTVQDAKSLQGSNNGQQQYGAANNNYSAPNNYQGQGTNYGGQNQYQQQAQPQATNGNFSMFDGDNMPF